MIMLGTVIGTGLPLAITNAETIAHAAGGNAPIPMGTTVGLRPDRLVIRGGVMVTGRGTPGTGRAATPGGPVDSVVENECSVDIIPVDPVTVASGLSE